MTANTDPQTRTNSKPESRLGNLSRIANIGVCVLALTACRLGGPTATPNPKTTTVGELSQQFQNGECPDGDEVQLEGVTLTPVDEIKETFNANADGTSFTVQIDAPEGGLIGNTFILQGVIEGDAEACILAVRELQATS